MTNFRLKAFLIPSSALACPQISQSRRDSQAEKKKAMGIGDGAVAGFATV
jgi:hypothetical protein